VTTNRVAIVEANLDAFLAEATAATEPLAGDAPLHAGGRLTAREAVALFECQLESRALDVAARELKRTGQGFYTIGSAGHENNACLGALLRLDDPCVLHYRSGGLMMARARKRPGSTPVFDTLLSLVASKDDPIAQGRHKAWGSRELWVPPQTSTIASHLPKATGMAVGIGLARRLAVENDLAADSIVCCSFGDASFNHATALAGIHSARWAKRRGAPVPVLFVCEDNGIGISVETPAGWIADTAARLPQLDYFRAAGELDEVFDAVAAAIEHCRRTRTPTFLHLETVRLWGHAGSDVETTYHTLDEIEANEAKDPLLRNAKRLVATGAATPAELAALVRDVRERVAAGCAEASRRPKLVTRDEIAAPLAPYDAERCAQAAAAPRDPA
jgi:2-oxoisovalerate dehydrogenase E1 component